jgi:hypothetical protein
MADVKISELTALTAPDGAEELVVNDAGTTKKITINNLFNQDIDVTGTVTTDGLDVSVAGTVRAYLTNTGLADTGEKVCFQWDTNSNFTLQGRDSSEGFKANWYTIETSAADGYADNHIFYTDSSAERMRINSTGVDVTGTVTADGLNVTSSVSSIVRSTSTNGFGSFSAHSSGTNNAYNFFYAGATETGRISSENSGAMTFGTGSAATERMRINSSGKVGIGTSLPASTLDVAGDINITASDYGRLGYTRGSTKIWTTGPRNSDDYHIYKEAGAGNIILDGHVIAGADNTQDFGSSSKRWAEIYAGNATINTSDRNEKQDIQEITTAERNVATACKGLMRSFRWKSAVAEKGDDARIHFGTIAQDLRDAFTAEGLDAGRYSMFISSTWWEAETEVPAVLAADAIYETVVTVPAVEAGFREVTQAVQAEPAYYDVDGNIIKPAIEASLAVHEATEAVAEVTEQMIATKAVEAVDAYTRTDTFETLEDAPEGSTEQTRLGVRYPELLSFIIAAM